MLLESEDLNQLMNKGIKRVGVERIRKLMSIRRCCVRGIVEGKKMGVGRGIVGRCLSCGYIGMCGLF